MDRKKPENEKKKKDFTLTKFMKEMFSFAGEQRGKIKTAVALAVIGELFAMLPYVSCVLLAKDVFYNNMEMKRTVLLTLLAIAGVCVRTLLCWMSTSRSHRVAFEILCNIRIAISEKMSRVPLGYMIETPIGSLKAKVVENTGKLEDFVAHLIPELPSKLTGPIACIVLIFCLDWRMGLASLITVPLGGIFAMGMMRGYSEKIQTYLKAGADMNSSLVEYVNGIKVIKAFGNEGASYAKFTDSINFYFRSTMKWFKQSWFWMAMVNAIFASSLLGTLPVGAYLYFQGQIQMEILILCLVLPLAFIMPLYSLAMGMELFVMMEPNWTQIKEFLNIEEQTRPEKNVNLSDEGFKFDEVSFSYDEGKNVLSDISLETHRGKMLAIVGPSGSGKSTIAKLMAGFWDPDKGSVNFGGQSLKNIPFSQLMQEISYVAQDNFLFDKTIMENIRMGKPDAKDEEIIEAAKAAQCHDFIMQLDGGYQTMAGDAGDKLSGGERQRITIARAMLKNSKVVILDEATAYTDPENESHIQTAINNLVKEKTLVVVAHRLSTIKNADEIIVLNEGKITARGRHEELCESSELYKSMWEKHVSSMEIA